MMKIKEVLIFIFLASTSDGEFFIFLNEFLLIFQLFEALLKCMPVTDPQTIQTVLTAEEIMSIYNLPKEVAQSHVEFTQTLSNVTGKLSDAQRAKCTNLFSNFMNSLGMKFDNGSRFNFISCLMVSPHRITFFSSQVLLLILLKLLPLLGTFSTSFLNPKTTQKSVGWNNQSFAIKFLLIMTNVLN